MFLLFAFAFASCVWSTSLHPRDLRTALVGNNITWSSETAITFPDSAAFDNATNRWTIFESPSYQAAISPATEDDVITAIHVARNNSIPFLVTGGRHGYSTTLGNLQNGLAIDLSMLNAVVVDHDAETVTVGPGAHFGDIFDPVFDAGFIIPTGSCSCVGVIGAAIGGGIGRLSGLYGLLLDQLVSARVVTAEGELLEVSDQTNADLFWAIRGAGANFAIITSATFRLSEPLNSGMFASYDMVFPAEKNGSFFDILSSLDEGCSALPEKLAVVSAINYDSTSGKAQILTNWMYAGTPEEAEEVIGPVLDLGPSFINATVLPWNRLSADAAFQLDASLCTNGQVQDLYGVNSKNLDVGTFSSIFQKMGDFYATVPEARNASIMIETFPNQATLAIPTNMTAYPWRDTKYNIMMQFTWSDSNSSVEERSTSLALELREMIAETSGYTGLTVYVNYAHGDETTEQIYDGDKLLKLMDLKKRWDPDYAFNFFNPLPII